MVLKKSFPIEFTEDGFYVVGGVKVTLGQNKTFKHLVGHAVGSGETAYVKYVEVK